MSRETDPDSDHYRCLHCGKEKDDHGLAVNDAGIVTAGTWTGPDTFTLCADETAAAELLAVEYDRTNWQQKAAAAEQETARVRAGLERLATYAERAPASIAAIFPPEEAAALTGVQDAYTDLARRLRALLEGAIDAPSS